jgi:hypothetical protein
MEVFTEQNSSFSFPLRALLGELSTPTGGGEPFRFMSGAGATSQCRRVPSVYWRTDRSGIPAHAVVYAVDFGALTPFPVCHPLYRAHSSEAQYGMYRVSVFMAHQHTTSPFSLVRPKNYYTNPHHGDSNIWEGTTGGRPTSCKKCVSMGDFTWLPTGWLMTTLVCRCETPATGRNWRGRGCW